MKNKCGYTGVTPYWDWTLGVCLLTFLKVVFLRYHVTDSSDTEHATIFDNDTVSGLGGWGDRNNDSQITTGGFKDTVMAYPIRHRIRRTYTLRPLGDLPSKTFPDDPQAPPIDPNIMINGTFTKVNYDFTLNGSLGNFTAFQTYLEGGQVCDRLEVTPASFCVLSGQYRVLTAVLISSWEAI